MAQWARYQVIASGVSILLIGGLTGALSSVSFVEWPLLVQLIVVGLAFAVGAFFGWGLRSEEARTALQAMLKAEVEGPGWHVYLVVLVTLWILAFATVGFAGVSELLYVHDVVSTRRGDALGNAFEDSVRFYVWSFLNAIPVLEIPQTLSWELHFEFTDHVSPVLVLLYKLAVIGPVLATGRLAWKSRRESDGSGPARRGAQGPNENES